jgi:hypothetical protein
MLSRAQPVNLYSQGWLCISFSGQKMGCCAETTCGRCLTEVSLSRRLKNILKKILPALSKAIEMVVRLIIIALFSSIWHGLGTACFKPIFWSWV